MKGIDICVFWWGFRALWWALIPRPRSLIALMAVTGIRANAKLVVAPLVLAVTLLTLELAVHGDQVPSEQLIRKVALLGAFRCYNPDNP